MKSQTQSLEQLKNLHLCDRSVFSRIVSTKLWSSLTRLSRFAKPTSRSLSDSRRNELAMIINLQLSSAHSKERSMISRNYFSSHTMLPMRKNSQLLSSRSTSTRRYTRNLLSLPWKDWHISLVFFFLPLNLSIFLSDRLLWENSEKLTSLRSVKRLSKEKQWSLKWSERTKTTMIEALKNLKLTTSMS